MEKNGGNVDRCSDKTGKRNPIESIVSQARVKRHSRKYTTTTTTTTTTATTTTITTKTTTRKSTILPS